MISMEALSFYIMICILAPLIGAFSILFLSIYEKRFEALETKSIQLILERELQQSKYEILSQKIKPHFFFNTLNSILGLARLDRKEELIHSIETFAKFMKRKYNTDRPLSTIEEELAYTRYYLDIQQLRMGDRLEVEEHAGHAVKKCLIPTYVIQTLTENCFKHSFSKYEGMARLTISIQGDADFLELSVWNSKQNVPVNTAWRREYQDSTGIGLINIQERLNLLYPDEGTVLKMLDDTDGTTVIMRWPRHMEAGGRGDEHSFN